MAQTTAERLAEAREALHRLLTGSSVEELQDQNGERVRYSRPSIPRLRSYIAELEGEMGQTGGPLRIYL